MNAPGFACELCGSRGVQADEANAVVRTVEILKRHTGHKRYYHCCCLPRRQTPAEWLILQIESLQTRVR